MKRFPTTSRDTKRPIALVIAAHNEALFIAQTIRSAIVAGQPKADIYVISDGSTDPTREIALQLLGADNVLTSWQQGKSRALARALNRADILKRYEWVHFADADTLFDPRYFSALKSKLDPKFAAVTGYIKSLPGTRTSAYRMYEYTWGMEVVRRFQDLFGLILVIPGPSACFRADVLAQIEMDAGTLTEDFDMTLQIFRRGLGRIGYAPDAVVYTQDPKNLKDYRQQITRWYRGIFQVARLRNLGFMGRREDWYFLYQLIQVVASFAVLFIVMPLSALASGSWLFASYIFLLDLAYFAGSLALSSWRAGKFDLLARLPHFYFMRLVSIVTFIRAFFEVGVLNRHRPRGGGWSTAERRYSFVTS